MIKNVRFVTRIITDSFFYARSTYYNIHNTPHVCSWILVRTERLFMDVSVSRCYNILNVLLVFSFELLNVRNLVAQEEDTKLYPFVH